MPKNESYKDLVKRLDAIINILLETFGGVNLAPPTTF
jgi:hypothetical protein